MGKENFILGLCSPTATCGVLIDFLRILRQHSLPLAAARPLHDGAYKCSVPVSLPDPLLYHFSRTRRARTFPAQHERR